MRHLKSNFLTALKEGELSPLLKLVKSDSSLCLELRGPYINVYYRGGNLMKVEHRSSGARFDFDKKYGTKPPEPIAGVDAWLAAVPHLKHAMDQHEVGKSRSEREAQQLLLRENNIGRVASSTDYYICDIEYNVGNRQGQFDMVGVRWLGQGNEERLVFVEVKYGGDAVKGASGIASHIKDINCFLSDPKRVQSFKEDMVQVFNQKLDLGLIHCDKKLESFSDERPLILLVLINQDPDASTLRSVLHELPEKPENAEVRVANGSFMGYGLWEPRSYSIEEVKTWLLHTSGQGR